MEFNFLASEERDIVPKIDFVLHIGGVDLGDQRLVLQIFSKYGEVSGFKNLTHESQKSFRIYVRTSHKDLRKIRADLESVLEKVRVRIVSDSETLQNTVFVRTQSSIRKEALYSYFNKFGPIRRIEMKFDPTRKIPRNFCYVIFENPESQKKALQLNKHEAFGKQLLCKPCRELKLEEQEDKQPFYISSEAASGTSVRNLSSNPKNTSSVAPKIYSYQHSPTFDFSNIHLSEIREMGSVNLQSSIEDKGFDNYPTTYEIEVHSKGKSVKFDDRSLMQISVKHLDQFNLRFNLSTRRTAPSLRTQY